MGLVVSFAGFTPPPRYDESPWLQARIEEAEAETGPWSEIDVLDLDPVDEDPALPATRNLTTDEGTLEDGWYRVTFLDADDGESVSDPVLRGAPTWRPTLAEVGALIRARTKDVNGSEVGTFNEDTRPTGTQVEELVGQAVADLIARVGADVPEHLRQAARAAAAQRAAQLVELSFWPEQANDTNLVYQTLRMNYEAAAKTILTNTYPRVASGGIRV